MKTCQSCGSISRDEEVVCGVCGSSLQAPTARPAGARTKAAEGRPMPVLGLRAKKTIGVGRWNYSCRSSRIAPFGANAAGFIVGFFVLLVGISTIFAALKSFKEELGPPGTVAEFGYRMREIWEDREEEAERERRRRSRRLTWRAKTQSTSSDCM